VYHQSPSPPTRKPKLKWLAYSKDELLLPAMLGISKFLQRMFYSNFQIIIYYFCLFCFFLYLTPSLLTWKIRWAPNNASRWQMGFNSAFKGLRTPTTVVCIPIVVGVPQFDKPCSTDIRQLFTIFDVAIVS